MLSKKSRPYIELSVPVLREHGTTITRTFYRNMFAAHPELTNLFNMGNQANGSQQQSLASAVFAYAANYENAEALTPVVSRIVHKHVSVGITAEHYPIVGHHLLGAIKETLGDAATDDLIEAWAEAYGLLADALIEAERNLYDERETQPGVLRKMRVVEVVSQGELVTSFVLEPLDGLPQWQFKPGQYMSIAVDFEDGRRQLRQYTLSDSPSDNRLRISVKREVAAAQTPGGQVSNWLHDNLRVSSIIEATPPSGDFLPAEGSDPVVLLSAGVGITPMISALNHIAQTNPQRPVIFAHATRDSAHHAHRSDLAAAAQKMSNLQTATFYERIEAAESSPNVYEGFMNIDSLPQWSRADTDVYLCGPIVFMRSITRALVAAGVPIARIHREVFGPEMLDELA